MFFRKDKMKGVLKMREVVRMSIEYEEIKNRYFEWLEDSELPLNLYDYAVMFEAVILK